MNDFWSLGGYAGYVWPAYAAALAILGTFTANALRRHRAAQRTLDRLEAGRR